MTYTPPRKTKPFWLRMTPAEYKMLETVARKCKTDKSKVILIALERLARAYKLL